MNEFQVTCITKPNRASQHEHITHIGNIAGSWKLTREEAIRRIDANIEGYYTIEKTTGKRAVVGVVRGDGNKAPYLRTHADGKWNDNLLAQDECTASCDLKG
ncbi:MAG TPA: DUF3892 domain-containing protein [Steroidobacteraceae bacterium]|jgi:hypothetical protein|nr:DUF3892 domain-containing protein [Steroidobacteraceae bacterium]